MSEACGEQRLTAVRNAEVSLLLVLSPLSNLPSSPSQRLCMPRERQGDGEAGHTTFQGTGSDAVKVRHFSLPAKELAA